MLRCIHPSKWSLLSRLALLVCIKCLLQIQFSYQLEVANPTIDFMFPVIWRHTCQKKPSFCPAVHAFRTAFYRNFKRESKNVWPSYTWIQLEGWTILNVYGVLHSGGENAIWRQLNFHIWHTYTSSGYATCHMSSDFWWWVFHCVWAHEPCNPVWTPF